MAAIRSLAPTSISACRRFAAALLAAALLAAPAAGQPAAPPAGLVSLLTAAKSARVSVERRGDAYYLHLGDTLLSLRPRDLVVREGAADVYHLSQVPQALHGDLYLAQRDADQLLALAPQPQMQAVRTFAIEATPTPRPRPTHAPVVEQGPVLATSAGRDQLLLKYAVVKSGLSSREFSLAGGGRTVSGGVTMDGYQGSPDSLTSGVLTIGSAQRHVQIGQEADTISGVVFYPERSIGAVYEDLHDGVRYFSTKRNGVRGYDGVQKARGAQTQTAALVTYGGRVTDLLIGSASTARSQGVTYTRETWIDTHGAAAGFLAQTDGRFFWESEETIASQGFPRSSGDAPLRENAGYRLSSAVAVRAGMISAYGIRPGAYFNATVNSHSLSLIATSSAIENSLGFTAHNDNGYASVAFEAGLGQRTWQIDAAHTLGEGQLELGGWSMNSGQSDASVKWRTTRKTAALLFGYETLREGAQHTSGPIAGVAFAIDRDLSAELDVHPLNGSRAIGISFAQRIDVSMRRRLPKTAVQIAGAQPGEALRYLLDGVPVLETAQPDPSIAIPDGTHRLSVQSIDDACASEPLDVDGGQKSVSAQLYPVRAIAGRILVDDPQDFVQPPELDSITVSAHPGGAMGATDASGAFALPAAPVPPDATVEIEADSLPDELIADGPVAIPPSGPVVIHVRAKRRIEKLHFRGNGG